MHETIRIEIVDKMDEVISHVRRAKHIKEVCNVRLGSSHSDKRGCTADEDS